MQTNEKYYTKNISDIHEDFQTGLEGLSDAQVLAQRHLFGYNELVEKKKKSWWMMLLLQFKDIMILILLIAAIISAAMGEITDSIIILVIVILNAIIGFVQEYRAEKVMYALKKMASTQAKVTRNGHTVIIQSTELVPGDLALIEAGDVVPADIRLTEAFGLMVDESALTGESVASNKNTDTLNDDNLPPGDQKNMTFKSTLVVNGRANGIVVATGMQTEIGKIAALLQDREMETPLKKRMNEFSKKLTFVILGLCVILLGMGLLRGEELVTMLLLSISLAVAAIPEALPALITIALAFGARRLVTQKVLIKKLPAVETLGSVSFICTDKTGTLTINKMQVVERFATPQSWLNYNMLDIIMVLNHEVKTDNQQQRTGDPTEIAMLEDVLSRHNDDFRLTIESLLPRVAEIPFDADRKCMTTVHRYQNQFLILVKGATEVIAHLIKDASLLHIIEEQTQQWGQQGKRVMAYAFKWMDALPEPFEYEHLETDLSLAGLTAMIDPPRPEVKEAVASCLSAGIQVLMITGDHPATAKAIAEQIGILHNNESVITGKALQNMSDEAFSNEIEKIRVYARVSPEQKLRIIRALQQKNYFVAMTGDGVNDAPSLKAANIGIAMGINGTDVSKEAAHMILLDDHFATIVRAVREGRRIYGNIRKFVKYILTCNAAEILTLFLAPIFGLPIPLLPVHILWINLVTDGLPGLALANEHEDKDSMTKPPRPSNESIFAGGIIIHIVWVSILMALVTLSIQYLYLHHPTAHWQTMVFTVLSLSQLGHVLAIRSDREFIFNKGLFSNLPLIGAVLLTFILQLGVIYLPFANQVFRTMPLSATDLLTCIGFSAIVFHAVEAEKWVLRKRKNFK